MKKFNVYISSSQKDQKFRKEIIDFNNENKIFNLIQRSTQLEQINPNIKDVDIIHTLNKLSFEMCDILLVLSTKEKPYKYDRYDWEIAAGLENKKLNGKNIGVLIIIDDYDSGDSRSATDDSEKILFKDFNIVEKVNNHWNHISHKYPTVPSRLIDNLASSTTFINVAIWKDIKSDSKKLKELLQKAHENAKNNKYINSKALRHTRILK